MHYELERSLRRARKEYARRGVIALDTCVQLVGLGVIVSELETKWETENESN